jgi:YHS domain-containing protein
MRIKSTLLLCSLFAVACAGSPPPPPAAPSPAPAAVSSAPPAAASSAPPAAASSAPLVAPGEAKVGDRTKCPVSGHEFVVKADSPHAEYNGKTYYFCCPDCPKDFEAAPEKFVTKA